MQPTSYQSINQPPTIHSTNQSINQSTNQPTHPPPTNQPTNQPTTNQPSNQPTNQPINHPTIQPTIQPTYQPTNQSINQPINQPTNQPALFTTFKFGQRMRWLVQDCAKTKLYYANNLRRWLVRRERVHSSYEKGVRPKNKLTIQTS